MTSSSLRVSSLAVALAATASLWGVTAVIGTQTGSTPAALAQAGPPGGGRGHMGELFKQLNLSDAQKAQIKGIMKSVRDQNENVTDPDQKRANFRAAFQKVEAVLTPAQRDKLKALRAKMHDQPAH